jgi:hypothetical protein
MSFFDRKHVFQTNSSCKGIRTGHVITWEFRDDSVLVYWNGNLQEEFSKFETEVYIKDLGWLRFKKIIFCYPKLFLSGLPLTFLGSSWTF